MYIYEMHQHTLACSDCANLPAKELPAAIRARGFAGVVMTNHFFHGNSRVDRELPWEEFVVAYHREFLEAKEEGDRLGVDVLFGLEEGVGDGKEILIYGVPWEVIAAHPELRELSGEALQKRYFAIAQEVGGRIYQAHPYRDRGYIPEPEKELNAEFLHGYEAYNACNGEGEDDKAVALAKRKGLPVIAGSDHHGNPNQARFFGIQTQERIRSEADLLRILTAQDYELYLGE